MLNTKKCEDCQFSEKQKVLEGNGYECRRDPPTVVALITPQGPAISSHFPTVAPDCYCGKFDQKIQLQS